MGKPQGKKEAGVAKRGETSASRKVNTKTTPHSDKRRKKTEADKLCLICHSQTTPELDYRDYFHPSNPKLLSKDLGNYFLLKHIFNLSSDQIQNYMSTCPCPSDWVKVCRDCTEKYVNKCHLIFLELLEVKRSFRAARNDIIEAVKRSVEGEGPLPTESQEALDITQEIRRLVSQKEKELEADYSIGDSDATKRLSKRCKRTTKERSSVYSDLFPGYVVPDIVNVKGEEDEVMSDPNDDAWFPADMECQDDSGDCGSDVEVKPTPAEDSSKNETSSPAKKTRSRRRTRTDADNTCPHCKKVCRNQFIWKKHQKVCSQHPEIYKPKGDNIQTQICDMCGSVFPFENMLEHMQSHVGNYTLNCPNDPCPFVFSNSKPMQLHLSAQCKFGTETTTKPTTEDGSDTTTPSMKKEPPGESYLCETCGEESSKRIEFQRHLDQTHERTAFKNYTCPVADCGKAFAVRQSVDFHLSSHMFEDKTFQKCELCSKRIKVPVVKEHLREVHKLEETFPCPHCLFLFSSRGYLIEHLHKHRHLTLFCDICGDGVKFTYAALRQHYQMEHKVAPGHLTCKICGKTLVNNRLLLRHVRREHEGETDDADHTTLTPIKSVSKQYNIKNLPCDLCTDQSVLYRKRTLFSHKVKVHGLEPLKCEICGKQYASLEGLQLHERSEHVGLKERPCPVPGCGKVFNTEQKLQSHTKAVHPDNTHCCSECGKIFLQACALTFHQKMVHLKIKPYVCDICGKGYGTMKNLKLHASMHTGEMAHQCDICDHTFRLKTSLIRHQDRVHHGLGDKYKKYYKPKGGKRSRSRKSEKMPQELFGAVSPPQQVCPQPPLESTQGNVLIVRGLD